MEENIFDKIEEVDLNRDNWVINMVPIVPKNKALTPNNTEYFIIAFVFLSAMLIIKSHSQASNIRKIIIIIF